MTPGKHILIVDDDELFRKTLSNGVMRTRFPLVLLSLAVALGVGACQTSLKSGKGPITLSWQSMAGFGTYKNEDKPAYFALADDGKSENYSYCFIGYTAGCVDDGGERALASCNRSAEVRGVGCSLFASGTQIVWDGPLFYEGSSSDYLFIYTKEVVGGKRSYSGKGSLEGAGHKISIRVGQCRGEADLNTKKWFIKGCRNDYSVYGTFVSGEGMKKYQGMGRSGGGGFVKMLLLDPASSSDPKFSKAKVSTYRSSPPEDAIRYRIEAAILDVGR